MVTVVSSDIQASGGDFTDVDAWIVGMGSDIVAGDEQHDGFLAAESFAIGNMTGVTCDATRFARLTTQSNASVADDITNALAFDSGKAKLLQTASYSAAALIVNIPFSRIEKIQIEVTGKSGSLDIAASGNDTTVSRCIIHCTNSASGGIFFQIAPDDCIIRNCLLSIYVSTNGNALKLASAANTILEFLTVIRPSNKTAGKSGVAHSFSTAPIAKNVAVFGFSDDAFLALSTSADWTITTCGTDNANHGDVVSASGPVSVAFTTATFVEPSEAGTEDFKAVASSDLDGAGTALSTTTDFFGQTRADPPTIGCFEIVAAGTNRLLSLNPPGLDGGFGNGISL